MSIVAAYTGGSIFDGHRLLDGHAARFSDGRLVEIVLVEDLPADDAIIDLSADILAPGYVDLQVNGGGGLMLNDPPSVETISKIAEAHRKLGVTHLLPTLITGTPETTQAAISVAIDAIKTGVPGIAGLHLEGPHLSVAKKGAHDGGLIRPMEPKDEAALIAAKHDLPVLKVTLAPENVTPDQVARLSEAGILVSLGHSNCDYDTAMAYAAAGARCVTHLFNAMSQIGSRTPGLVGAALSEGSLSAGLIADGVHVHPATMRAAWSAKTGPGQIFLVSDAMAVAGTDLAGFELGGRAISRKDGRLTLADGTLAGADLDLTRAVSILVNEVGVPLSDALAAATRVPAALCGLSVGRLTPGHTKEADVIRVSSDLTTARPLA